MSYTRINTMSRTVTFQPNKELGSFIEDQVETGRFQNQSEVVRAGLRLLQEQEANSKLQQLRDLIDEGKNSPVVENWTKENFLAQVKSKVNAKK